MKCFPPLIPTNELLPKRFAILKIIRVEPQIRRTGGPAQDNYEPI